jgi:hypothetical protein
VPPDVSKSTTSERARHDTDQGRSAAQSPTSTACYPFALDSSRILRAPPQTPTESSRARIYAALPLNELPQRLGARLVRRRVPHGAAPLAPGSLVGLGRVGGGPDDGGKRIFPVRHRQPLQAQRPAGPVDFTAFRGPPGHQPVHSAEISIDGVPVPAGLAIVPDAADPFQVLRAEGLKVSAIAWRCVSSENRIFLTKSPEASGPFYPTQGAEISHRFGLVAST